MKWPAVACFLTMAAGCASSLLERRVDELRNVIADATKHGAARCAPVELALSSVHLEFAELELRQGDAQRAEQHLILAEPNGKAALRLATEGRCEIVDPPRRAVNDRSPRRSSSRRSSVAAAEGADGRAGR